LLTFDGATKRKFELYLRLYLFINLVPQHRLIHTNLYVATMFVYINKMYLSFICMIFHIQNNYF